MSDFHPLEVVGRGSETQLQVGENLNTLTVYIDCLSDGACAANTWRWPNSGLILAHRLRLWRWPNVNPLKYPVLPRHLSSLKSRGFLSKTWIARKQHLNFFMRSQWFFFKNPLNCLNLGLPEQSHTSINSYSRLMFIYFILQQHNSAFACIFRFLRFT